MSFKLPTYKEPNFQTAHFKEYPDAAVQPVEKQGVAPDNFHATTIFPEYYKVNGKWHLLRQSRMDCVVVLAGDEQLEAKELRRLEVGDQVILGRTEDGSEGIYIHTKGFRDDSVAADTFAFRTGRSRETSYSRDYDRFIAVRKNQWVHYLGARPGGGV